MELIPARARLLEATLLEELSEGVLAVCEEGMPALGRHRVIRVLAVIEALT